MNKSLFASVICLLILQSISGQTPWSLTECINYAYEHNLDIKKQRINVSLAEYDQSQSRYNILPNLNAGFSYNLNTGRYFDEVSGAILATNTNGLRMGVSSSIDLFNGMRNYYLQKYYAVNSEMNTATLDKTKNDISITIATAYLNILFNKELYDLSIQQLNLIQQQVAKTQKLVDVGNVARGELLEIKAQEANEKLSKTNAENSLNIAMLSLAQLLDLDSLNGFDIQQPDFNFDLSYQVKTINDIYNEALAAMPQVYIAKLAINASEFQEEVNKSYYYPSLNMNYNFSTYYSDNLFLPNQSNYTVLDQWSDNRGSSFSVGLSIPIFNKFQVNTSVAKAQINTKSAEYDLEITKLTLYKEIQQAQLDLKSYYASYISAVEAVEYNKEAFQYTEQKREVGLIDAIAYNTAKNNLKEAEVSLVQAKYQYVFQQKLLDFYTGKPLMLN